MSILVRQNGHSHDAAVAGSNRLRKVFAKDWLIPFFRRDGLRFANFINNEQGVAKRMLNIAEDVRLKSGLAQTHKMICQAFGDRPLVSIKICLTDFVAVSLSGKENVGFCASEIFEMTSAQWLALFVSDQREPYEVNILGRCHALRLRQQKANVNTLRTFNKAPDHSDPALSVIV